MPKKQRKKRTPATLSPTTAQTPAQTRSIAPPPPPKDFLDLIAPTAARFQTDSFIMGGTHRSVLALRGYPTSTEELERGWSAAEKPWHRLVSIRSCFLQYSAKYSFALFIGSL